MIDTQILVHMEAGHRPVPPEPVLGSVAAKEFLMMYGRHLNRDRYYLPVLPPYVLTPELRSLGSPGRERLYGPHATDRILIEFNNLHPTLIEYGSYAVTVFVNSGRPIMFDWSVAPLGKSVQKVLKRRFRYLLACGFRCFALDEEAAGLGLDILASFLGSTRRKLIFGTPSAMCSSSG